MIILDVSTKIFTQFRRRKVSFALIFAFPFFFLLIFSLAFSGNNIDGTTTYDIVINNLDEGIFEDQQLFFNGSYNDWKLHGIGENYSNILADLKYPDEDIAVFNVKDIGQYTYNEVFQNDVGVMIIEIPPLFSQSVLSIINVHAEGQIPNFPTNINVSINYHGQDTQEYKIAQSISQTVLEAFIDAIKGDQIPRTYEFEQISVLKTDDISIFDFIAAGIFVFATILSVSYFASIALEEISEGTIQRLKLSLIKPNEYIAGFIIFSFIVMLIQSIFLFIAATVIFNFNPAGSLINAFVIMSLLTITSFALIFTAGATFKKSDDAGSALGFASSIVGFASGAFFPMPEIILVKNVMGFTSGSADLLLWDLLPWTHAVNCMRAILLYNQSLGDVIGDILILIIVSIPWFLIALKFYTKRMFGYQEV
ncbi:MAG: ABC transporter permease [Candidatus Heimdallarchaeota archaeon]|nr:ABC transporter permease [Candidatus Heimdallarchaeota archaeon]MDH5646411.1 ABC transporter permease [Candidatus Heimdallarchaeota archaeon]